MKSVKSDNSSGWRTKRWQYWREESVKLEESKLKCHSSRDQTLFKIEIKPSSSQKSWCLRISPKWMTFSSKTWIPNMHLTHRMRQFLKIQGKRWSSLNSTLCSVCREQFVNAKLFTILFKTKMWEDRTSAQDPTMRKLTIETISWTRCILTARTSCQTSHHTKIAKSFSRFKLWIQLSRQVFQC